MIKKWKRREFGCCQCGDGNGRVLFAMAVVERVQVVRKTEMVCVLRFRGDDDGVLEFRERWEGGS